MAAWLDRLPVRARSSARRLLWLVWPSHPTAWADLPGRLRPFAVQTARLAAAAVLAYLVADAVSPGILDLTASLTALLVVQASTVGTLQMGLVRVGAVLTGVLVAVGISTWIGLSWWSLGAVIAASLLLAKVLRLGEQTLEAPISAMLILAVSASSPELAAEVRVVNTVIGTMVGIGFSLVLPVSIPSARATTAVRRVARSQAALLDEVALTLADRAPQPDEVAAWRAWLDDIDADIGLAVESVQKVELSRRLNPRALTAAKVHPGLRAALDRLDHALSAERLLLALVGREVLAAGSGWDSSVELRRAFSVVVEDVSDALRCFGDLVSVEFGGGNVDRVDQLLERTLEIVRETRAVLTELVLLDVDPRSQPDLWMLQGSVLGAVEQVVAQLDLEQNERSRAGWLIRYRDQTRRRPRPEGDRAPAEDDGGDASGS
ncbi:MAG: FUSC family protein [Propionibacteriaceae bacterium]